MEQYNTTSTAQQCVVGEISVADSVPRTLYQYLAVKALPYLTQKFEVVKDKEMDHDLLKTIQQLRADWRDIGRALYAEGNTRSDWIQWSETLPQEIVGNAHETCAELWKDFEKTSKVNISENIATAIILPAKHADPPFPMAKYQREWKIAHGQADDAAQPPTQATDTPRYISAQDTYAYEEPEEQDDEAEPPADEFTQTATAANQAVDEQSPAEAATSDDTEPARDSEEKPLNTVDAIRDACKWSRDKHGKRTSIKAISANMNLIFTNDPNLRGLIGYDEFQQAIVFLRQPPWYKDNVIKKPFDDSDDAQLSFYLRENYAEFHSKQLLYETVIVYSRKNAFHDVKDYFYNLPHWNGIHRAETLFIDFLRVNDTPFAREVTRKWLLGCVARIFRPGCRFQFALVLQGKQGVGKSYILERLGGEWHGVLSDSVDDPHAIDAIQAMWICELKEFKAARNADINSLKAFIDTSADTRRFSYAKRPTKVPRHNANAITVNDKQFLTDKTGNRRFPVLESESEAGKYIEGLSDEFIAQVWAEVFHWYNEITANDTDRDIKKIEKALELSKEAKLQVEAVAEQFMRDDGLGNEIQGYLDTPIPAQVLWLTLTKEERSKFMADAHIYIGGGKAELETRIKNRKWNRRGIESDITELYRLLASENNGTVYRSCGEGNAITIYGTELRQHVSVAEILYEAFQRGDKRANNYRVGEVMDNLSGWTLGSRLRNADPQYPDQTKPYFRDKQSEDDEPTEEKQAAENLTDDFFDMPINALENPPF